MNTSKPKNQFLKSVLRFVNTVSIYTITLSFIHFPIVGFAAQAPSVVDDSNSWFGGLNGAIQKGAEMYSKNAQQSADNARMQNLYQQLEIKPIPAMYFPQCTISQAQTNIPEGMCDNVADAGSYQMATAAVRIADQYDTFFEQLISDAQNTPHPVGIKCLKDSYRKEMNALQQKINYLTNLTTKINEQDKLFKEELGKITSEMDQINFELTGGSEDKSLDQKTTDIAKKYFNNNAACKAVLNSAAYTSGNGLMGILDSMTQPSANSGISMRDLAGDTISKEQTYKSSINTQIDRLINKVHKYGVSDLESTFNINELTRGGLTQFDGMQELITQEVGNLNVARKRAADYLRNELDYDLPSFDNNFSSNISTFASQASTHFKRQSIDKCVTGGLGLSQQDVIANLTIKGKGTSRNYKDALLIILNEDSFMEQKLSDIAQLDKQYGIGTATITVKQGGGKKSYTPYTYYKEAVSRCNSDYENNKTVSATGGSTVSDKQKVAQAQKYINEMKSLEQNFNTDMATAIKEQYLTCSEASTGTGSCNENSMNPSDKGFCVNKAVKCATSVNSCLAHTDNIVKTKKAQMKNAASIFNAKVAQMAETKRQLLQNETLKAIFNAEWYGKYFNNSPYQLPEDLSIPTPGLEDSEYGVKLRGGNAMAFLDPENPENLGEQITKLKDLLINQSKEIESVVSDYIAAQEGAIQSNKQKWSDLKNTCKSAMGNYKQQIAKVNAENTKNQGELNSKVSSFCRRYSTKPICGGTNSPSALMEESMEIAGFINPDALDFLAEAEAHCLSEERDTEQEDEDDYKKKSEDEFFVDQCAKKGSGTKLSTLGDKEVKKISNNIRKYLRDINAALSNDTTKVKEDELRKYLKGNEPSKGLVEKLSLSRTGDMVEVARAYSKSKKDFSDKLTCATMDKAIDDHCKSEKGNSSKKECIRETKEDLSNLDDQSYSKLGKKTDAFISYKDSYDQWEKYKSVAGQNIQMPSCTASSDGNRRVGEQSKSVDSIFYDMINRVSAE